MNWLHGLNLLPDLQVILVLLTQVMLGCDLLLLDYALQPEDVLFSRVLVLHDLLLLHVQIVQKVVVVLLLGQ